MTIFRLGYVAMSVHIKNSSPSQTMTFKRFSQFSNREAAIQKLEDISTSNIKNCLRLLKHNRAHDITFFRLSSKLIPLATHEELAGWDYITPIQRHLQELGEYACTHDMRIDFHPDHYVVLNTPNEDVLKTSVKTLKYHYHLIHAMGIDPVHRCVLHTGGKYGDKEKALERFIDNWGRISPKIQQMLMLENDDKSFNLEDVLYLSEKLSIPTVFDIHHHQANHIEENWTLHWERIIKTWNQSPHAVKVHLSSPKSTEQFRHHADFVDPYMFLSFANEIKGSVSQIDCMIEAKQKDEALFQLVQDLKKEPEVEWINDSTFRLK